MATPRFKVDSIHTDRLRLPEHEAHHALRVRRVRVGEVVTLFDGSGGEADARVVAVGPEGVEVECIRRHTRAVGGELHLAVAVPKGPRADWMVEKLAELGVAALLPLRTARAVVIPSDEKLARWRRKAAEAAKQCRSACEMRIEPVAALPSVLTQSAAGRQLLVADPGPGAVPLLEVWRAESLRPALVVVGPEGGLTESELALLREAGATSVTLGENILRIETAALAVAAAWALSRQRRTAESDGPKYP